MLALALLLLASALLLWAFFGLDGITTIIAGVLVMCGLVVFGSVALPYVQHFLSGVTL